MSSRLATTLDSPAIAEILNEGIEDRVATFETRRRSSEDVAAWFDGVHPVVVVERYRRHSRLDGVWRDVVIVERMIGEAAGEP